MAIPFTAEKMANLEVKGNTVGDKDGFSFSGEHRLQISQDLLVILVQSDKLIYNPGQTGKALTYVFIGNSEQTFL